MNRLEYAIKYRQAIYGLFILVYLTNYEKGMNVYDRIPVYCSAELLISNLFSRALNGNDRRLVIEKERAKAPIHIGGQQ